MKETGQRPLYTTAREETRQLQNTINFVKKRIGVFGKPYDRVVRNAIVHVNYEIDMDSKVVTFYEVTTKSFRQLSYERVITLTEEMSALVSSFRLLVVILSNNDWKKLDAILTPPSLDLK